MSATDESTSEFAEVTDLERSEPVGHTAAKTPAAQSGVVGTIVVTALVACIVGLSLWYLVQPQPLSLIHI